MFAYRYNFFLYCRHYTGMMDAFRKIVKYEGVKGLYKVIAKHMMKVFFFNPWSKRRIYIPTNYLFLVLFVN